MIFRKGISTAPIRNLKARDVRPLVSERNLFLGILKSQSRIFRSVIFLKGTPTAPIRNLEVRAGRPLVSERTLFANSKIPLKNLQVRDFLERDSQGAHKES